MPIELTTGVPGAGKTLYTVAEVLKPLETATVEFNGRAVPRRLCIAGIPDLLIAHELMEAPAVHVDTFTDPWGELVRRPDQPPVEWATLQGGKWVACAEGDRGAAPVPMLAENWWVWVRPGDVVVIDECQTVFRPMSAGKRAPGFVRQLEVHRHYGIDFVLITQHPQLLHSNVRALVGKHRHVRRLFGRGAALIYEWDHCSPPDRIKTATSSVWRYRRKAFELYKSAQLHTKQKFAASWPMYMGILAVLATPVLWWFVFSRTAGNVDKAAAAGKAPAAAIGEPASPGGRVGAPAAPVAPPGPAWPVYGLAREDVNGDPYGARAFQVEGQWSAGAVAGAVFGLLVDGKRVGSVMLSELVRAGYSWSSSGPCAGLLRFRDQVRRVTCGPPGELPSTVQPSSGKHKGPDGGEV